MSAKRIGQRRFDAAQWRSGLDVPAPCGYQQRTGARCAGAPGRGRLATVNPVERLNPQDKITGREIVEFWQWAYSALEDNTVRGVLAEWLVGVALACVDDVRQAWGPWDLETATGVHVEVKASGYVQRWEQNGPSTISFSGLCDSKGEYHADVYVFGVQTATTRDEYDKLDVSQWEWWVADRRSIEQLGQATMGLATVKRIAAGPVAYDDLAAEVERVSRPDPG